MQYFNNSKKYRSWLQPIRQSCPLHCWQYSSACRRIISPASILLYHCYFPCTCLPAVASEFLYRHLLNLLLETLPPLLGTTITEGLFVTCHISGLTSCYWLHTNSFNSLLNPPAAKLSYQYAENRKLSPIVVIHCWAVSCQQVFKSEWQGTACRAGPALQTVPHHCSFERRGNESKIIKVHAIF